MNSELIVIIVIVLALALLTGIAFILKRKRNRVLVESAADGENTAEPVSNTPIVEPTDLNWYQRRIERIIYYRYARSAYKTARGTQHRILLQEASRRLVQKQKANEQKMFAIKQHLRQLQRRENAELETRLQRWIATEHLKEVSGIGAKRYDELMRQVFHGKLEDFYRAQDRVSGIGDKTQLALNAWVKSYKRRLADMIQSDFPDKQAIVNAYAQKRKPLLQQQTALEKDIADIRNAQKPIERELRWLNQVDFETFRNTYKCENYQVDRYLLGVFAEWEEMPDWFKSALKTEV